MPYSLAGFVQATATTWVSLRGVWGRRECERSSGMRHSSPGKPIGTCAIPTQSRHNLDAISTQSRGISRQSEARRGNQWQSRGISRPSEARRGNQWPSRGISRPSEARRGNQWQSEAIRGNRRQSEARRDTQRQSEAIRGNHLVERTRRAIRVRHRLRRLPRMQRLEIIRRVV
jgi:hypothetical protein